MLSRFAKAHTYPGFGSLFKTRPFASFSKVAQLATNAQEFLERTRNVAIIAHVDHGKTTLVDTLLRYGGIQFKDECAMDSNEL